MSDQLDRTDLAGMTPEQIVQAKVEGRLDVILGQRTADHPTSSTDPYTQADLRAMTPEQIVAARDAGDLDHLLDGTGTNR